MDAARTDAFLGGLTTMGRALASFCAGGFLAELVVFAVLAARGVVRRVLRAEVLAGLARLALAFMVLLISLLIFPFIWVGSWFGS